MLITVDCGITSKDDLKYASDNGLDVFVVDHHEPPADKALFPECVVIDPKQEGEDILFQRNVWGRPCLSIISYLTR